MEDLGLQVPELGGLRRRRRAVLRLLRPARLAVHLVTSPVTAEVAGSWISSREGLPHLSVSCACQIISEPRRTVTRGRGVVLCKCNRSRPVGR